MESEGCRRKYTPHPFSRYFRQKKAPPDGINYTRIEPAKPKNVGLLNFQPVRLSAQRECVPQPKTIP